MNDHDGGMAQVVARHWPEYLIEAWGLGTFMVSAGLFGTLLECPASPVRDALPDDDLRRLLMGIAMGLTAILIIYSPWGKQSGAHLNPAVTLTFWRLGKIRTVDALFYGLAQFAGGALGVLAVWLALGDWFGAPPVHFVNTLPGPGGAGPALLAEIAMGFCMMLMVLTALPSAWAARFIGVFAGILVATYITLLAPVSGMGLNPARSFSSALPAGLWQFLWIYFVGPPLGMLAAVEVRRLIRKGRDAFCCKLNHDPAYRCIHCSHEPAHTRASGAGTVARAWSRHRSPIQKGER